MADGSRSCTGRGIVRGVATGPAIVSRTPFSFLGDVDIRTGKVVGESCDILGETIAGAVLLIPATRGSAGAWRFLYQLKAHGTHPVAIVTAELPDPSVVQGAILAEVPIVCGVPDWLFDRVERGSRVTVDGIAGSVSFESGGR